MDQITKRLSRDVSYKPPEKTYQKSLSDIDIAKKLEDYIKVKSNDIFQIPLNTHVRYFSTNPKTGQKEFRLGGVITKFGDNGEYVVLSNGKLSWSVQIKNTIFYKKLTLNEIKEKVQNDTILQVKSTDINKETKNIEQILEENKKLKKMLKEIKETTIQSKSKKK
jgi:hypothetical protein